MILSLFTLKYHINLIAKLYRSSHALGKQFTFTKFGGINLESIIVVVRCWSDVYISELRTRKTHHTHLQRRNVKQQIFWIGQIQAHYTSDKYFSFDE